MTQTRGDPWTLPGTKNASSFDASAGLDALAFTTSKGDAFVLTGGLLAPSAVSTPFEVNAVRVSKDGAGVVLLGEDASAVFDVTSGGLWMLPKGRLIDATFSDDGKSVLAAAEDETDGVRVMIWQRGDEHPLTAKGSGRVVRLSFGERPLVVFDRGATLDLLDAITGELRHVPKDQSATTYGRFSFDQRSFVHSSELGTWLCDVASWTCLPMPRAPGSVVSGFTWDASFGRDGKVFVAGVDGVDSFEDDLPRDPLRLREWLETATTLSVDRDDAPAHCAKASTVAVHLSTRNASDRAIAAYSVDADCREVFFGMVAPQETFRQDTFVGHPWRFRDARTHDLVLDYPGAKSAEDVSLSVDEAIVPGGHLAPAVIQHAVRASFPVFRACYESGLRRNPKLAGRVAVHFAIDETGRVLNAKDDGSDLPDKVVVGCVVDAFWSLRFPGGGHSGSTVVYPISFAPGN